MLTSLLLRLSSLAHQSWLCLIWFIDLEAKFILEVLLHLVITDASIKVIVHRLHQLENLLLCNGETHPLKHVLELIHFDVVVLVLVDLIKDCLQGETSLLEHFHKVVEDFILGEFILPLLLHIFDFFAIVGIVKIIEFPKFDYAIFIWIDFLK